jgi:hypothetical protein
MDYRQKALALSALGWYEFAVKIRDTGEWYAVCAGEIGNGRFLTTPTGNGGTPEAAIDDLWDRMTVLKPGELIVLDAYKGEARRTVRWNGFMWEPVREPAAA